MCGSYRNHCCGLILTMFMLGCLVQRGTIVVTLYWRCFRFIEEPEMSMGVGGWDEYYISIICRIHASCISEISTCTDFGPVTSYWFREGTDEEFGTLLRWRVSGSERGPVTSFWFREEPMTSGLISNITLTSKFWYEMHWSIGNEYIAYIITFVIYYCCGWSMWLMIDIFKLSLLFYAPLTYMNVFSLIFVFVLFFTSVIQILG